MGLWDRSPNHCWSPRVTHMKSLSLTLMRAKFFNLCAGQIKAKTLVFLSRTAGDVKASRRHSCSGFVKGVNSSLACCARSVCRQKCSAAPAGVTADFGCLSITCASTGICPSHSLGKLSPYPPATKWYQYVSHTSCGQIQALWGRAMHKRNFTGLSYLLITLSLSA